MARDNHHHEIPSYILDDLSTRFLNNLPEQEYSDLVRVFFQVEQAYWFFLDFYCNKSGVKPCAIKDFSEQIFRHCPVLVDHYGSYEDILRSWREYKLTVPRYGVIILDPAMEKCLLVRGMGPHSSWTFPKGKINEGESEVDCAIRETEEEIGYDSADKVDPNCYLEHKLNDQYNKLYIIRDVPTDTPFQTKTRNEIRSIKWWPIATLPSEHGNNHFLFVYPFVNKLRSWIDNQRRFHQGYPKRHKSSAASKTAILAGGISSNASRSAAPSSSKRTRDVANVAASASASGSSSRRKHATPVVSGLGRGRHVPRQNFVGSENDDDVIVRPGDLSHQPFQQVAGSRKSYQGAGTADASPLPLTSLFPDSSRRRLSKHRQRNSLSGGTSGEGGDEATTSKPQPISLGAIAISRSALGLIVPGDIVAGKVKTQASDVETDAQPQDALSNGDEEDDESDDEDEGDDESGDAAGLSADDARLPRTTAAAARNKNNNPVPFEKGVVTSWDIFRPECWKNFAFDRTLIFQAWDAND